MLSVLCGELLGLGVWEQYVLHQHKPSAFLYTPSGLEEEGQRHGHQNTILNFLYKIFIGKLYMYIL
jgi:hypothetical protein